VSALSVCSKPEPPGFRRAEALVAQSGRQVVADVISSISFVSFISFVRDGVTADSPLLVRTLAMNTRAQRNEQIPSLPRQHGQRQRGQYRALL
jgi:hypothetical protein